MITKQNGCRLAAFGWHCVALALTIPLALSAGLRPAVAQFSSEFPVPTAGSLPYGVTTGPDGAVWFIEAGASSIGRITNAGVVTSFPTLTPNSQPQNITTGPDGALWFTEYAANRIGRLTTAGVLTEFVVFTPGGQPNGITVGP